MKLFPFLLAFICFTNLVSSESSTSYGLCSYDSSKPCQVDCSCFKFELLSYSAGIQTTMVWGVTDNCKWEVSYIAIGKAGLSIGSPADGTNLQGLHSSYTVVYTNLAGNPGFESVKYQVSTQKDYNKGARENFTIVLNQPLSSDYSFSLQGHAAQVWDTFTGFSVQQCVGGCDSGYTGQDCNSCANPADTPGWTYWCTPQDSDVTPYTLQLQNCTPSLSNCPSGGYSPYLSDGVDPEGYQVDCDCTRQPVDCPNNCYGNGLCDFTDGTCACFDGYQSPDCTPPSPSPSVSPSGTPSPSVSRSPSTTPSPSRSPSSSSTPSPSVTPSPSQAPSPSISPSASSSPSVPPSPGASPSCSPSSQPSESVTPSSTPSISVSPSTSSSPTSSTTPTVSPTASMTPSVSASATPSVSPSPSVPPCFALDYCNGAGQCTGNGCNCTEPYSGPDCSEIPPTSCGDLSDCNACLNSALECAWCIGDFGNQYCSNVTACPVSHQLPACEPTDVPYTPEPCPDDCSGHGKCKNDKCDCDPGWSGINCSEFSPVATAAVIGAGAIALIVVGAIVFVTASGGGAYAAYRYNTFATSNTVEDNPMYEAGSKEADNPLYERTSRSTFSDIFGRRNSHSRLPNANA